MIQQYRLITGLTWGLILVVSLTGCGTGGVHLSGLAPAKGVVRYNGSPVEGVSIMFVPDGTTTTEQRTSSATTNASGQFTMMTLQTDDGVFPGQYKVVLTKLTAEYPLGQRELGERPTFKDHLPKKYAKAETTPFSLSIDKKGNTAIAFDLTD